MLPYAKLDKTTQHDVRRACAYLFSPAHANNIEFLESLEIESVKKAFREKAKRYHPDRHGHEEGEMISRREERFLKIKDSRDTLLAHIPVEKKRKRHIIAVGGAKGGIGKSVFASNLAVTLSSMGARTVVADLDLGGANLHLYLGETAIDKCVNDFVGKRAQTLDEIMILSRYGPMLMGGDSSRIGAANINLTQKAMLLKAISRIDADYIILDLGGDTSYNIIDFFLAGDTKIVMTTCEPAAYLEAYNFIKVALYRKLTRLADNEEDSETRQKGSLRRLISEALAGETSPKIKRIDQLKERVHNEQRRYLPLLNRALASYQPLLLVNRETEPAHTAQVIQRIREVSKKMLSIDVTATETLPYLQEIEKSARELIPVVVKHPNGIMAKKIRSIADNLIITT